MRELNENTLKNSLSLLPLYEAPECLWDTIDNLLSKEENKKIYRQSLSQLPEYEPSSSLWDKIEYALENPTEEPIAQPIQPRRISFVPRLVRIASAAAVLLVGSTVALRLWMPSGQKSSEVTISYSEEVVSPTLSANEDANATDRIYQVLMQRCEAEKLLCNNTEFKSLQTQLDELTNAKERLQEALGQFGDDPTLKNQLGKIERERNTLLMKMLRLG